MAAVVPDKAAETASESGVSLLPLIIAIALTLLLTIYPPILTTSAGKADHAAATLALWSMSAGFIRGVGFVPRNRLLRVLFSTTACLVCLALAATLIAQHRIAS
ncbi:MAG: cyd operon YbgE family protein [Propionivibrio sp.]|nr:cyd operon YbgE family protein [Propionivibrio sp.]